MKWLSLANRNFKEIYRDPVSLLLGLLLPVIFLILFSSIQKKMQLDIFSAKMLTPAITVFSFTFLMMFSAMLLAKDRDTAFLTRLLTTPLKPWHFVLAYLLPFIPFAVMQMGICFLVGSFFGVSVNTGSLLSVFFLLPIALTCVGFGIALGSLFTVNQVSGIGSLLITVFSLFSGTWMDIKMIGGVFEMIATALPFYHAIDASRNLVAGYGINNQIINFLWIFGYLFLSVGFGVISFRWRTRR